MHDCSQHARLLGPTEHPWNSLHQIERPPPPLVHERAPERAGDRRIRRGGLVPSKILLVSTGLEIMLARCGCGVTETDHDGRENLLRRQFKRRSLWSEHGSFALRTCE